MKLRILCVGPTEWRKRGQSDGQLAERERGERGIGGLSEQLSSPPWHGDGDIGGVDGDYKLDGYGRRHASLASSGGPTRRTMLRKVVR